jgi:hypothetical protein
MTKIQRSPEFIEEVISKDETWVDKYKAGRMIIHPESAIGFNWTLVTMLLVLWSAVVIPERIAFESKAGFWMHKFDLFMEVWFLADIFVNFHTGYLDKDTDQMIMDPAKIRRNYSRGWFLVDAPSSFPAGLFTMVSPDAENMSFLRVIRMAKMFRLVKLLNIKALQDLEDSGKINPATIRLAKLAFEFLIAVHFIACGYW